MATDIGFEIRLIPKHGGPAYEDIEKVRAICEHAKDSCALEGLYGKYWFNLKEKSDYLSVQLYGYYRGNEEDDAAALETVLELTWQDEENAPLITATYFAPVAEVFDIRVVRDYW